VWHCHLRLAGARCCTRLEVASTTGRPQSQWRNLVGGEEDVAQLVCSVRVCMSRLVGNVFGW
jgi:hypothetical protein